MPSISTTSAADAEAEIAGISALHRLKSTESPLYLTPSPELSQAARSASQYLFSAISPHAPKSPFTQLLTDGFDAEQIWQQIDLQTQPLISSLRRRVRYFEKNPGELAEQFIFGLKDGTLSDKKEDGGLEKGKSEGLGNVDEDADDFVDDEEDADDVDDGGDGSSDDDDDDDDDDDGKDEGEEDENLNNANGVEDKFLKIKELEEYLVADEAREYGSKNEKRSENKRKRGVENGDYSEEDEDEDGEGEDEDDEGDDELGLMAFDDESNYEEGDEIKKIRYEDFFGSKKTGQKKKSKSFGESDSMDMDNEHDNGQKYNHRKQSLSTHQKEQEKLRSEIEEMERANLEPKTWTMQGEVTAAKRPKNSALEVDIDFEHSARPAPVITEEVTASLEELIQKRILEGRFDDIQKPPTLATKTPMEKVELDENKSKKGLAEHYEDEYAQKTGLVSAALSFSDEQKKEATMLFKKLCLKLDALSHFHFAPKPVIEEMSIKTDVPALAMEEVAPVAVSDAAMLAPEEVFSGKGDVKEETELTKAERKRRRANKKRKYKAESVKQVAAKVQPKNPTNIENGKEDS